jgi:nucleoside-diphosphate-sugar epimerase
MNKVLVTGGSGFIGTNLINYILSAFPLAQILNLDLLPPRDPSHAALYQKCDINDLECLRSLISDFCPTHVFHLAAATGIGDLPLSFFQTNINGVSNLIASLEDVPCLERVVFASSLLVCKVGYIPESFDEYLPTTTYGISKMKGEILVKALGSSVDWVIVRPISIWGPWNSEPYLQFFKSVLRYYYFNIGRYRSFRSLGYVGNTVYQLCCIASSHAELVSGKTFYLADYSPLSLKLMARKISSYRPYFSFIPTLPLFFVKLMALLGDALSRLGISFPLTSFRLNNLLVEYVFDLSSLREICGPLPFSPDDGIKLTIEFLRSKVFMPLNSRR